MVNNLRIIDQQGENPDSEHFYNIAKAIEKELGVTSAVRIYAAIFDGNGKALYASDDFTEIISFISPFIKDTFERLKIGDHSFPISGKNIGIFKVSDKAIVVLYSKKGHLGALLNFKNKMSIYASKIDEQLEDFTQITIKRKIEVTEEITITKGKVPSKKTEAQYVKPSTTTFAKLPVLLKELTGKEKFPLNDVRVLQLCDGKHTIEDIIKKTKLSRLEIQNIVRNYQKKKVLNLKRTQV